MYIKNIGIIPIVIFSLNIVFGILNAVSKKESRGAWICATLGWICTLLYASMVYVTF